MTEELFITALFLTLVISRVSAHWLYDRENYWKKKDNSKTFTDWLRGNYLKLIVNSS